MTPLLPAFVGTPEANRVYNVDALALLRALPDNYVDLVVTSPPYDNLRTYKGFTWDFESIAHELFRVLKPGGVCVWVVGDMVLNGSETLTSFKQAMYFKETVGFRMHDTMIYWKNSVCFPDTRRYNASFEYMFVLSKEAPKTVNLLKQRNRWAGDPIKGRFRQTNGDLKVGVGQRLARQVLEYGVLPNVWEISPGYMKTTKDVDAYEHPAMFPEELARRHILTWSNPGDLVLDPFLGSGTTAKMARLHNRNYLGCDVSHEYCEIARKRLAQPYTPNMFDTLALQVASS